MIHMIYDCRLKVVHSGTQETLWSRPEKLLADACGLQEDDRSSAEPKAAMMTMMRCLEVSSSS